MDLILPMFLMTALLAQPGQAEEPPAEASFSLTLSLTKGERSKDSNRQRFDIEILEGVVRYDGAVGPCERGQCGHAELEFNLTEEERETLLQIVEDDQLLEDFEEVKDTGSLGHFVSGTLVVTIGDQTATTTAQGMISTWLKDVVLLDQKEKADALVEIAETFFDRATALKHTKRSHTKE